MAVDRCSEDSWSCSEDSWSCSEDSWSCSEDSWSWQDIAIARLEDNDETFTFLKVDWSGDAFDQSERLLDALEGKSSVSELEIELLGNHHRQEALICRLRIVLQVNNALRSLSFSTGLSDESVKVICDALTSSRTISALEFGDIESDGAARAVAGLLKANHMLDSVSVGDVCAGDAAQELSDAFEFTFTIVSLRLRSHMLIRAPVLCQCYASTIRNAALTRLWRHVALIAKGSGSATVRAAVDTMTDVGFRCSVFSWFLPAGVVYKGVARGALWDTTPPGDSSPAAVVQADQGDGGTAAVMQTDKGDGGNASSWWSGCCFACLFRSKTI